MSMQNDPLDNDPESDDPMDFVREYCIRRGLPFDTIHSAAEREAYSRASDAREQYKSRRNDRSFTDAAPASTPALTSPSSSPQPVVLTDSTEHGTEQRERIAAQKYKTRLRNNRKSAHAAKVFKEVLKREVSRFLHYVVEGAEGEAAGEASTAAAITADRIRTLEDKNMQQQAEIAELKRQYAISQASLGEANLRLQSISSGNQHMRLIPLHHSQGNPMLRPTQITQFPPSSHPQHVAPAAGTTDPSGTGNQRAFSQALPMPSGSAGPVLDAPLADPRQHYAAVQRMNEEQQQQQQTGLVGSQPMQMQAFQSDTRDSAASSDLPGDIDTLFQSQGTNERSSNVPPQS